MDTSISMTINKIRDYYEKKVKENKNLPAASMPDAILVEKEISLILNYIEDGDKVLDVGCANGYSTLKYAVEKYCYVKGIDFSRSMIKNAMQECRKLKGKIKYKVKFEIGDVTKLKERDNQFDKAVSKRCVINLPSWKLQRRALSELIRILKIGGELLLSEASRQGWENLNKLRQEFGLQPIPQPWFNLYLDEEKLFPFMEKNNLQRIEVINFSSTYYIGSRVIQPFVIGKNKEPDYNSEINHLFSLLPSYGNYGTQKIYRFRKEK